MPIYEFGYRNWQGDRLPNWLRWWPIARAGFRRALASRALRRWIFASWMPVVWGGFIFFTIGIATEVQPGNPMFRQFDRFVPGASQQLSANPDLRVSAWSVMFAIGWGTYVGPIMAFVVAIVGPPLISTDMRDKSFLLYFSKPITKWDYILGKAAVLAAFIASISLFQSLVLYAESVAFSSTGALAAKTLPVVFGIVISSVAVIVPATSIALMLSSLCREARYAAAGWMGICFGGEACFQLLRAHAVRDDWVYLFSLREMLGSACWWAFDGDAHLQNLGVRANALSALFLHRAPPLLVFVALSAVTVFSIAVVQRRVTAPIRV